MTVNGEGSGSSESTAAWWHLTPRQWATLYIAAVAIVALVVLRYA